MYVGGKSKRYRQFYSLLGEGLLQENEHKTSKRCKQDKIIRRIGWKRRREENLKTGVDIRRLELKREEKRTSVIDANDAMVIFSLQ